MKMKIGEHLLAITNLRLPDIAFVKQTLHTVGEICPACLKQRNAEEMVWQPNAAPASACCIHCVHLTPYAQDVGIRRTLVESEDYVLDLFQTIDPYKWLLKPSRRIRLRDRVADACAFAVQTNWNDGKCIGRFTSVPHVNGINFVTKHRPCIMKNRGGYSYFSRFGNLCSLCLPCSASSKSFQKHIDLKERQRAICEGMRYALFLSGHFDKLVEIPRTGSAEYPYTLDWIDWRTGDTVNTEHVEEYRSRTDVLPSHVSGVYDKVDWKSKEKEWWE